MVPHETLETKILESLGLEPGEQGIVTVVGVPDKSKREQLVLLTICGLSRNELRKRLPVVGVPILWIPKIVKRVRKSRSSAAGKSISESADRSPLSRNAARFCFLVSRPTQMSSPLETGRAKTSREVVDPRTFTRPLNIPLKKIQALGTIRDRVMDVPRPH